MQKVLNCIIVHMKTPWDNVDEFERIVADYAGAKYGVATDSCTNAIFLCIKYLQNMMQHELAFQVPKHTYLSVPMAVENAGAELEFVDSKWCGTYQLSPYPIHDSATQFYQGMYTGGMQCVSFHIKKHIPIGRGGMILTDDAVAVDWLKQARYDGRQSVSFNDIKDVSVCGYHMYMQPDQAARGIELFYRMQPNLPNMLATWEDYPDVSNYSCFASNI